MSQNIGRPKHLAREFVRKHGITPLRNILTPQLFDFISGKPAPTNAILIPEVVFWLMATVALNQGASMASAPLEFWASLRMSLPNLRLRPVTEEAFCMARKALPLRFFVGLFGHVVTQFTRRFSDNYRWRGFRLLGIDGMKMTLPCSEALKRSFPPGSNQKGLAKHPQALLVGLVGLLDGVCIAGKLVASKGSEQKCARDLSALLG